MRGFGSVERTEPSSNIGDPTRWLSRDAHCIASRPDPSHWMVVRVDAYISGETAGRINPDRPTGWPATAPAI